MKSALLKIAKASQESSKSLSPKIVDPVSRDGDGDCSLWVRLESGCHRFIAPSLHSADAPLLHQRLQILLQKKTKAMPACNTHTHTHINWHFCMRW